MSQVSKAKDNPVAQARALPPLTWHGSLTTAAQTPTHYLHLSAFPCANCNGPVIAGSLGTRPDDITREINVREIGALCLACGFRPESVVEPSVGHRFRPVQWNWVIQEHARPANLCPGPPELSPEAGGKR